MHHDDRTLSGARRGAALIEYMFLTGFLAMAIFLGVHFLGLQQKDIYEHTACKVEETRQMAEAAKSGGSYDGSVICDSASQDVADILPPDPSGMPCDYDALLEGEHCPGINIFYIGTETFSDGSSNRMYTYVPGSSDAMVGLIPAEDPQLQWAVVDEMDMGSDWFAQYINGGPYNSNILNNREFPYPGANFCAEYGFYLPTRNLASKMFLIRDKLRLGPFAYMTSTQYWPVMVNFNKPDNYQWIQFMDDNPMGNSYTFVEGMMYVRCVFDQTFLPGKSGPRTYVAPPFGG